MSEEQPEAAAAGQQQELEHCPLPPLPQGSLAQQLAESEESR
jgi:hypothetical protein